MRSRRPISVCASLACSIRSAETTPCPRIGGAIVTSQGLIGVGVTGVRKAGTDALVTPDDKWHLGSDTKAMTATMIGLLVQQGKLRWDSTIGEVFTDLASNSARR
jgi:CubicO group peptidase (beta-lactamase class C family)